MAEDEDLVDPYAEGEWGAEEAEEGQWEEAAEGAEEWPTEEPDPEWGGEGPETAEEWEQAVDEDGNAYWTNTATGEASWDPPPDPEWAAAHAQWAADREEQPPEEEEEPPEDPQPQPETETEELDEYELFLQREAELARLAASANKDDGEVSDDTEEDDEDAQGIKPLRDRLAQAARRANRRRRRAKLVNAEGERLRAERLKDIAVALPASLAVPWGAKPEFEGEAGGFYYEIENGAWTKFYYDPAAQDLRRELPPEPWEVALRQALPDTPRTQARKEAARRNLAQAEYMSAEWRRLNPSDEDICHMVLDALVEQVVENERLEVIAGKVEALRREREVWHPACRGFQMQPLVQPALSDVPVVELPEYAGKPLSSWAAYWAQRISPVFFGRETVRIDHEREALTGTMVSDEPEELSEAQLQAIVERAREAVRVAEREHAKLGAEAALFMTPELNRAKLRLERAERQTVVLRKQYKAKADQEKRLAELRERAAYTARRRDDLKEIAGKVNTGPTTEEKIARRRRLMERAKEQRALRFRMAADKLFLAMMRRSLVTRLCEHHVYGHRFRSGWERRLRERTREVTTPRSRDVRYRLLDDDMKQRRTERAVVNHLFDRYFPDRDPNKHELMTLIAEGFNGQIKEEYKQSVALQGLIEHPDLTAAYMLVRTKNADDLISRRQFAIFVEALMEVTPVLTKAKEEQASFDTMQNATAAQKAHQAAVAQTKLLIKKRWRRAFVFASCVAALQRALNKEDLTAGHHHVYVRVPAVPGDVDVDDEGMVTYCVPCRRRRERAAKERRDHFERGAVLTWDVALDVQAEDAAAGFRVQLLPKYRNIVKYYVNPQEEAEVRGVLDGIVRQLEYDHHVETEAGDFLSDMIGILEDRQRRHVDHSLELQQAVGDIVDQVVFSHALFKAAPTNLSGSLSKLGMDVGFKMMDLHPRHPVARAAVKEAQKHMFIKRSLKLPDYLYCLHFMVSERRAREDTVRHTVDWLVQTVHDEHERELKTIAGVLHWMVDAAIDIGVRHALPAHVDKDIVEIVDVMPEWTRNEPLHALRQGTGFKKIMGYPESKVKTRPCVHAMPQLPFAYLGRKRLATDIVEEEDEEMLAEMDKAAGGALGAIQEDSEGGGGGDESGSAADSGSEPSSAAVRRKEAKKRAKELKRKEKERKKKAKKLAKKAKKKGLPAIGDGKGLLLARRMSVYGLSRANGPPRMRRRRQARVAGVPPSRQKSKRGKGRAGGLLRQVSIRSAVARQSSLRRASSLFGLAGGDAAASGGRRQSSFRSLFGRGDSQSSVASSAFGGGGGGASGDGSEDSDSIWDDADSDSQYSMFSRQSSNSSVSSQSSATSGSSRRYSRMTSFRFPGDDPSDPYTDSESGTPRRAGSRRWGALRQLSGATMSSDSGASSRPISAADSNTTGTGDIPEGDSDSASTSSTPRKFSMMRTASQRFGALRKASIMSTDSSGPGSPAPMGRSASKRWGALRSLNKRPGGLAARLARQGSKQRLEESKQQQQDAKNKKKNAVDEDDVWVRVLPPQLFKGVVFAEKEVKPELSPRTLKRLAAPKRPPKKTQAQKDAEAEALAQRLADEAAALAAIPLSAEEQAAKDREARRDAQRKLRATMPDVDVSEGLRKEAEGSEVARALLAIVDVIVEADVVVQQASDAEVRSEVSLVLRDLTNAVYELDMDAETRECNGALNEMILFIEQECTPDLDAEARKAAEEAARLAEELARNEVLRFIHLMPKPVRARFDGEVAEMVRVYKSQRVREEAERRIMTGEENRQRRVEEKLRRRVEDRMREVQERGQRDMLHLVSKCLGAAPNLQRLVWERTLRQARNHMVAVVFDPGAQQRLVLETLPLVDGRDATYLQQQLRPFIRHRNRNLVAVRDVFRHTYQNYSAAGVRVDDWQQIVTLSEYVPMGSAAVHVKRYGPVDPERLMGFARQLASAVKTLHSHGVRHGNITLSSIFLADREHVKLGGWRVLNVAKRDTHHCSLLIKAEISPPELLSSGLSLAADIWALGCCVYWMALGRQVDMSNKSFAAIKRSLPISYGQRFRALLAMALEKDPEMRGHAEDLLDLISETRQRGN